MSSGPSRAKLVQRQDGTIRLEQAEDGPGSGATTSGRRKRGLKSTVVQAASGINLFAKPLILSDPVSLKVGKGKTCIFIVSFVVSALFLIIFNAVNPQVVPYKLVNPSYEDYLAKAAPWSPVCPCKQTVFMGNFTEWHVDPASDYGLNFCKPLIMLGVLCGLWNGNGSISTSPCIFDDQSALLMAGYLSGMTTSCSQYNSALDNFRQFMQGTALGEDLMPFPAVQATVVTTTTSQLELLFAFGGGQTFPIVGNFIGRSLSSMDFSFNSTVRSPSNCSCTILGMAQDNLSPLQTVRTACRFRAWFDTRPGPEADTYWTCNGGEGILGFPLQLLTQPKFYTYIGFPEEYAAGNLTDFAGAQNITNTTSFFSALSATAFAYYGRTIIGTATLNHLNPNLIRMDLQKYYQACNPSQCTWSQEGAPGFIGSISITLGLLAGLQTVLTMLIDKGYDVLHDKLCKKKGGGQEGGRGQGQGQEEGDYSSSEEEEGPEVEQGGRRGAGPRSSVGGGMKAAGGAGPLGRGGLSSQEMASTGSAAFGQQTLGQPLLYPSSSSNGSRRPGAS